MKHLIYAVTIIILTSASFYTGLHIADMELKISITKINNAVVTQSLPIKTSTGFDVSNLNSSTSIADQLKIAQNIKEQSTRLKEQMAKTLADKKKELGKIIPESPQSKELQKQISYFLESATEDLLGLIKN